MVCSQCHHFNDCAEGTGIARRVKGCSFVAYPNHPHRSRRQCSIENCRAGYRKKNLLSVFSVLLLGSEAAPAEITESSIFFRNVRTMAIS